MILFATEPAAFWQRVPCVEKSPVNIQIRQKEQSLLFVPIVSPQPSKLKRGDALHSLSKTREGQKAHEVSFVDRCNPAPATRLMWSFAPHPGDEKMVDKRKPASIGVSRIRRPFIFFHGVWVEAPVGWRQWWVSFRPSDWLFGSLSRAGPASARKNDRSTNRAVLCWRLCISRFRNSGFGAAAHFIWVDGASMLRPSGICALFCRSFLKS